MIKDSDNGAIAKSEGSKLNSKPKRPKIQDIQDEVQSFAGQAQRGTGDVIAEFNAQIDQGEEAIAAYVEERVIRMPYAGIAAGIKRVAAGGEAGESRPFLESLGLVPGFER